MSGVTGALSGVGRQILDALDEDGLVPLEEIASGLARKGHVLSAEDFLGEIFALFQGRYVTIAQEPIPAFGQAFCARVISPSSPREVLGDAAEGFDEFCAAGDYVRKEKACARQEPAGVPFGIYLGLTGAGRRERTDPKHGPFRGEE